MNPATHSQKSLIARLFSRLLRLGLLRIKLYALALIVIIFSPLPGTAADYQWPGIVVTVVMPALAPLVFMVVLFDAVMSKVVASDASSQRGQRIFLTGLILASIVLLRWLPYLLALG